MLDQLGIAIHEIANISERRIERLVHPGNNNYNNNKTIIIIAMYTLGQWR